MCVYERGAMSYAWEVGQTRSIIPPPLSQPKSPYPHSFMRWHVTKEQNLHDIYIFYNFEILSTFQLQNRAVLEYSVMLGSTMGLIARQSLKSFPKHYQHGHCVPWLSRASLNILILPYLELKCSNSLICLTHPYC